MAWGGATRIQLVTRSSLTGPTTRRACWFSGQVLDWFCVLASAVAKNFSAGLGSPRLMIRSFVYTCQACSRAASGHRLRRVRDQLPAGAHWSRGSMTSRTPADLDPPACDRRVNCLGARLHRSPGDQADRSSGHFVSGIVSPLTAPMSGDDKTFFGSRTCTRGVDARLPNGCQTRCDRARRPDAKVTL
jgi:hypothetical protein